MDKDSKKLNITSRHNTQQEKPKKAGWFKKLLFAQSYDDEKQFDKQQAKTDQTLRENQQLRDVVGQLDKKVEQNNTVLLQTLDSLKANNESLLQQIQILSESNKQLYEKMLASNKKAKVLKIFALIASIFTITLGAYNLFKLIFGG